MCVEHLHPGLPYALFVLFFFFLLLTSLTDYTGTFLYVLHFFYHCINLILLLEAPQNARTRIYQPPAKSSPKQELGVTGISSVRKVFSGIEKRPLILYPLCHLEHQKPRSTLTLFESIFLWTLAHRTYGRNVHSSVNS